MQEKGPKEKQPACLDPQLLRQEIPLLRTQLCACPCSLCVLLNPTEALPSTQPAAEAVLRQPPFCVSSQ